MEKSIQNEISITNDHQNQLSFDINNHHELSKFPMKKDDSTFIDFIDPAEFITTTEQNDLKKHNISIDSFQMTLQDDQLNLNSDTKRKSVKTPTKMMIHQSAMIRKRVKHVNKPSVDEQSDSSAESIKRDIKIPSIIKIQRFLNVVILLQNVTCFINKLTQNSRISSQLTHQQHTSICDVSSTYGFKKVKKSLGITLNVQSLIFTQIVKIIPIFSPYSIQKRLWDTLQVLLILVLFYFISLSIFFELSIEGDIFDFYQLCLLTFFIDTLVTLNTGVILKGQVKYSRQDITKHYFKEYFLSDFLGNTSLLLFIAQNRFQSAYYKIIQLLIIMKWVKLQNIFTRLSFYLCYEKNQKNMLDLIRLLFLLISICHVFCCFWHGLALYEMSIGMNDTWLHHLNIVNTPIMERYVYSFYFLSVTMITVGYGDITPQNSLEIVFTITTMFLTGMVYAFSLNTIGSIIDNIEEKDKNYKENMQVIHGLMREENVSQELRTKISNYLEYLYKESNEVLKNQQKSIIEKLSNQLQRDFIIDVKGKYLKDIPFFNSLNQKNNIMLLMEETLYSPGEYIFEEGSRDDCSLYYIVKGSVQLVNNKFDCKEYIISTKVKQQYFGEISFITGFSRYHSARANDFCRIYRINRQSFLSAIKTDDHDFEQFTMLKDNVIYKHNYLYGKTKCDTCLSSNHYCVNCPKTHLVLSKTTVFQRFNFSQAHVKRQKEGRKISKKIKSLFLLEECMQGVYDINDKEEFFEILDELEKNQNLTEPGYTSENIENNEDYMECIAEEDEYQSSYCPVIQNKQIISIHSLGSQKNSNLKLQPTRKSLDLSTQQFQNAQLSTLQEFDKNTVMDYHTNPSKSRILSSATSSSNSSSSSESSFSRSNIISQPLSPNRGFNRAKSLFSNMSSINPDNKQLNNNLFYKQTTQSSNQNRKQINLFDLLQSSDVNNTGIILPSDSLKNKSESRIKTFQSVTKSITDCIDKQYSEQNTLQLNVVSDQLNESSLDDKDTTRRNGADGDRQFKAESITSIGSNRPYSRLPSRYLQQQEKKVNSQLSLSDQQKKVQFNPTDQCNISSYSVQVNNMDSQENNNSVDKSRFREQIIVNDQENTEKIQRYKEQRQQDKNATQSSIKQSIRHSLNPKRQNINQEQLQQSIGQFMKNLKQDHPIQYFDYVNQNMANNGNFNDKKFSKSIKPSFFSQKGGGAGAATNVSFMSVQNGLLDQSRYNEKYNQILSKDDKFDLKDNLDYEFLQIFENAFIFSYYFPNYNFVNVIERRAKFFLRKFEKRKKDKKNSHYKKVVSQKQKVIPSFIS